jgi:hypothetical protein
MRAAPSSSGAAQPSCDCPWPEDDGLRAAALKSLQASGYAAVRRLRCEVTGAVVIVHGVVPSYFLKQMAQAALQQLGGIQGVGIA